MVRRSLASSSLLLTSALFVGGVVSWSRLARGQAPISIALDNLALQGVNAESVRYRDRQTLRIIEADASRSGGLAIVKGATFRDGVIEVDVAGRRGPHAVPDDRGFIGLAFRVSPDGERFEYIYLRPENGRAEDQIRRNHSTQYASHPDFPWPRMRKEFPERYESYVDLEAGVWTRMRVEVSGASLRLFVHGATQPTLVVSDLKLGAGEGGVGLWIGAGTDLNIKRQWRATDATKNLARARGSPQRQRAGSGRRATPSRESTTLCRRRASPPGRCMLTSDPKRRSSPRSSPSRLLKPANES